MADHSFCRRLLAQVMEQVRVQVPDEIRKEAWAYNYKDGHCEFQIPSEKMYWYGGSCCNWHAKYKGWNEYLDRLRIESLREVRKEAELTWIEWWDLYSKYGEILKEDGFEMDFGTIAMEAENLMNAISDKLKEEGYDEEGKV